MPDFIESLTRAAEHASGLMARTGFKITIEVQPGNLLLRAVAESGARRTRFLTMRDAESAHENTIILALDQLVSEVDA